MQWEQLTASDFALAARDTGVCILALGVLERHAEHLPLGTDYLNGHRVACLAAEQEAAVVFPPFYFGQIYEARCFPGAVALKPTLLLEFLTAVLDEIGRNGFRKIVLYNAHGGNNYLLRFLTQASLWEEKPYTVYLFLDQGSEDANRIWRETVETEQHGHACECETSISLANHPDLVRMDRIAGDGMPRRRLEGMKAGMSGIWWYADFPEHYAGDATPASAEKGRKLQRLTVDALATYLKAVKEDTVTPALEKEFFQRERKLRGK